MKRIPKMSGLFSQINLLLCSMPGNNRLLAENVENFSKSPIRPAGSDFWQAPNLQGELTSVWMNSNRVTFFIMCNLEKRLIRVAFWVLLHTMFSYDWKQPAQRLKLRKRLLTIKTRNAIRWNIYRDNNFHLRRIESADLCLSRLPGVCYFPRWTPGKKIAPSFLFTTKIMTKYSSERLLSIICGQEMSKGF